MTLQTTLQHLRDDPFASRLLRNLKWIFSSQFAIALLGMLTLAITARALGAAGLGVLALIEAFSRIVARLVHLEPWQALIHHGSDALENDDKDRFAGLIGLSILLDLLGGAAAAVVLLIIAPFAAPYMGLEDSQATLLSFGALAIALSLRATGIGLMRLFDRFDTLAKIDVVAAATRAGLAVIAYFIGAGLPFFIAIFVIFSLIEGLAAFLWGLKEARTRGQRIRFTGLFEGFRQNPGYLRMTWNSNLSVMLRQTTQRLDVVILSALVPAVAVGYYHIARRTGETAIRLGRPISQALYPELARFAARADYAKIGSVARMVTLGFAAVLTLTILPLLFFMTPLITMLFGPDFIPATPIVSVQAIAVALPLSGVILGPVLLSLEQDRQLVRVGFATASLFFILIVPLVTLFGALGAALTNLVVNAIWLISCTLLVRRALARKYSETPKPREDAAQ